MQKLMGILPLFILLQTLAWSDPFPRNQDLKILHYTFELTLSDSTNLIRGLANVEIRFLKAGVDSLRLDLAGLDTSTKKGMAVQSVMMHGKALHFSEGNNHLNIYFSPSSHPGDTTGFEIAYSGIPSDGLIISKNEFGDRTFFGDNWPDRAHDWLPVIDHPSQKATVDFIVTAPSHYRVVANGQLASLIILGNGNNRTCWIESVPIATKLMVIGVARFAIQYLPPIHGVPVESWVYPQDSAQGFYDFAVAEKALMLYEKYLGPFPYEKLANVQSTTRYGGMENASCIFYDEKEVTGKRTNEVVVAHEIAHQWFGDDVSEADWDHIWLSEGFATFFQNFYIGKIFGMDSVAKTLGQDKKIIFRYYRHKDVPVVDTTITNLNQLLNANSYQKGGYVLRMLEHFLGEQKFWAGLRLYHHQFQHGNALTSDFEKSMAHASGENLDWFFTEWIYKPGYLQLHWDWTDDPGSRKVSIRISQTQKDSIFRMPVEVCFYSGGRPFSRHTLHLDQRVNNFQFQLSSRPDSLVLDPDQYVLMQSMRDTSYFHPPAHPN